MLRVNTLGPRQNGRHFADDILKCIFMNENVWILITISLKFVPKGPINNIPSLVQVMAWRRAGDKPLSEPMMVSLPTHICVTRLQWVKAWMSNDVPQKIMRCNYFSMLKCHYLVCLLALSLMSYLVMYITTISYHVYIYGCPIWTSDLGFLILGDFDSVIAQLLGGFCSWTFFNSLWPSDAILRQIWVNIGSGNGVLPDGTKPLPEPMLTDHQWSPLTFILGQFHKRCLNRQWLNSIWKLHI